MELKTHILLARSLMDEDESFVLRWLCLRNQEVGLVAVPERGYGKNLAKAFSTNSTTIEIMLNILILTEPIVLKIFHATHALQL